MAAKAASSKKKAPAKSKAQELKSRVARGAHGILPVGTKVADIDPPLSDEEKDRLGRLGVI